MPFEQHLKELKLTTFLSDYDKVARELGLMKKTSQDLNRSQGETRIRVE